MAFQDHLKNTNLAEDAGPEWGQGGGRGGLLLFFTFNDRQINNYSVEVARYVIYAQQLADFLGLDHSKDVLYTVNSIVYCKL